MHDVAPQCTISPQPIPYPTPIDCNISQCILPLMQTKTRGTVVYGLHTPAVMRGRAARRARPPWTLRGTPRGTPQGRQVVLQSYTHNF